MAQGESLQLRITFDGSVPGLAEHRLSVSEFLEALRQLLLAYRRIASGLISDMLSPEYGKGGGKYADQAKVIDLEISEIKGNSPLQVAFACTAHVPPGGQYPLFSDNLLKRTGKTLLESLEAESQGEWRNAAVRKYLIALPPGIRTQKYQLQEDEKEIGSVTIGDINIASLPEQLPYLERVEGDIVGVGFTPGPNEVRIKPKQDSVTVLSAKEEQVFAALEMRKTPVVALALTGKTKKVLSIRPAAKREQRLSHEEAVQYIHRRWGSLLQKLAE